MPDVKCKWTFEMADSEMHDVRQMVAEIHTALFGPKSNPEEGVFAIAKNTEKRVAKLETTASTIWAVIISLPIIAGALALFGYSGTTPPPSGMHQ